MSDEPAAERSLRVAASEDGMRLDAFLAARLGVGRRAAARLSADARVNGRRSGKGALVAPGDEILLPAPAARVEDPTTGPEVVYADASVLVIDKPSSLATVAIAGRPGPTLADWIARRHPECTGIGRPGETGLVHRLDTDTSGLLLVARSPAVYDDLRSQFTAHAVRKRYLALVAGRVEGPLRIDAGIGQHRKSRTRVRAIDAASRRRYAVTPATTDVAPLEVLGDFSLVAANTRTGARHQIRIHLAHAGHPLVADRLYGGPSVEGVDRLHLHASHLEWRDVGGELRRVDRPPPGAWASVAEILRQAESPSAPDRA